jgi:hypothetical protein
VPSAASSPTSLRYRNAGDCNKPPIISAMPLTCAATPCSGDACPTAYTASQRSSSASVSGRRTTRAPASVSHARAHAAPSPLHASAGRAATVAATSSAAWRSCSASSGDTSSARALLSKPATTTSATSAGA